MKLQTDAVAADLPDDRIAVFYSVGMDFAAHIPEICPRNNVLKSNLYALLCHFDQAPFFRRDVTDAEHSGRIGKITVQNGRAVDIDNVAVFKNVLCIRNSVADFLVDGCADTLGKTFIMERRRNTAHIDGGLIYDAVNIFCGHTGGNFLRHRIKAGHIDLGTFLDPVNMLLCLEQAVIRNDRARELVLPQLLIKTHMAGLIFAAAAAPARIIAFHFMFSKKNHPENSSLLNLFILFLIITDNL